MAQKCTKMIDVDKLIFGDNVRSPECQAIPAMVESLRRHGFKVNHPLVLSEKADQQYLVLIGNRRGLGLVWLRENEPDTYRVALPDGKIPAIVHKGLTREEETELRIDHSSDEDRVPLDEWSVFLAIKQLLLVGIDTQERIATKLGLFKATGKKKGQPNREYVQPRVNLARLPQFVQDEFRKLTLDKSTTAVRWVNVSRLYKTYNIEYVKHPAGDGPEFQKLWEEITTPEAVDAPQDGTEPKELSPAEAIKKSQSASSIGLKEALLAVTRQSDGDLAEIDARLVRAESAAAILVDVQAYLGEKDYTALVDSATKQGDDRRAAVIETQTEAEAQADVDAIGKVAEKIHSTA